MMNIIQATFEIDVQHRLLACHYSDGRRLLGLSIGSDSRNDLPGSNHFPPSHHLMSLVRNASRSVDRKAPRQCVNTLFHRCFQRCVAFFAAFGETFDHVGDHVTNALKFGATKAT